MPPRSRTSVSLRLLSRRKQKKNTDAGVDTARCCPLQSCTAWTWRANTACSRTTGAKSRWCLWGALSVRSTGFRSRSRRSSTKVGGRDVTPCRRTLPASDTLARPLSLSSFPPGAVILLGRTNMFRFNHPKEAAKLREKRKVNFGRSQGHDLLRVPERRHSLTLSLCRSLSFPLSLTHRAASCLHSASP